MSKREAADCNGISELPRGPRPASRAHARGSDERAVVESASRTAWQNSAMRLGSLTPGADNRHRPPLVGDDTIDEVAELLSQRDKLYTGLADAVIKIDGLSTGEVLERLVKAVG